MAAMAWVKVDSKSHPGRSYYYNRITRESTWERPPDFHPLEAPAHPVKPKSGVVADCSSSKPLHDAWSETKTSPNRKVSPPKKNSLPPSSQLEAKTKSFPLAKPPTGSKTALPSHRAAHVSGRGKMDRAYPPNVGKASRMWSSTSTVEAAAPMEVSASVAKSKMKKKKSASGDDDVEAMEVERWGEEEEVAMDVDISEADIAEIKSARQAPYSSSHFSIESFGIPADYTSDYSEKLYLVLDTNVLLSHLSFLEELKDYAIKGVGKPVLVIPWVVMQELDNHKMRGNSRLSGKARKGIRLLFNCFSSKHPRVRCQTMEEMQTEIHNVAIENNDDRILHCCLLYQLKTKGHNGVVVLFSNDLNLCTKALGNGVKAADRTTLFKELRAICKEVPRPILSLPLAQAPPPPSPSMHMTSPPLTPFISPPPLPSPPTFPPLAGTGDPRLQKRKVVNDLLMEAEAVVRDTLSPFVKQEMVVAFDDLWTGMVVVKPPWSLKDLLYLIDRHWIAVYKHVLPFHTRAIACQLLLFIKNRPGAPTLEEAMAFLDKAVPLLQGFTSRSNSKVIAQAVASLNTIYNKLRELKQVGTTAATPSQGPSTHQPPVAHVAPMTQTSFGGTDLTESPSTLPLLTIPTLPSSTPLDHMKQQLTQMVQAPPTEPAKYLEWILGLIHDSIIYCQSMVHETLGSSQTSLDRANVSQFVRQIAEMLSRIVTSLHNLIEHGISIPRMQETLVAFDFFLHQVLLISSPMTIDVFFELASLPEQRLLLETALKKYSSMLTELHTIDTGFQL